MDRITPKRLREVKAVAQAAHTHDQKNALCWMGADDFDEYAPEVAEYIANADPNFTLALIDLVERSRKAEARVRALHHENAQPDWPQSRCHDCDDMWPCPTIQALDTPQETP